MRPTNCPCCYAARPGSSQKGVLRQKGSCAAARWHEGPAGAPAVGVLFVTWSVAPRCAERVGLNAFSPSISPPGDRLAPARRASNRGNLLRRHI